MHIPPLTPNSEWPESNFSIPWWKDDKKYCIGKLTTRSMLIKVVNTLSKHEDIIEVAKEETINEILDRYLKIN